MSRESACVPAPQNHGMTSMARRVMLFLGLTRHSWGMRFFGGVENRLRCGSSQLRRLGLGFSEADLHGLEVHAGYGVGQVMVSQTLQEQVGEVLQDLNRLAEQIALGEQLHEQVRDLQDEVQAHHYVEVVAVAEVFHLVAGFLLVESFVLNLPAHSSSMRDFPYVVFVDGK